MTLELQRPRTLAEWNGLLGWANLALAIVQLILAVITPAYLGYAAINLLAVAVNARSMMTKWPVFKERPQP